MDDPFYVQNLKAELAAAQKNMKYAQEEIKDIYASIVFHFRYMHYEARVEELTKELNSLEGNEHD